jgi:hypothetical protein
MSAVRRARSVVAALAVAALLVACTPLKPWERGRLLDVTMRQPGDELEAACDGHVHRTREGMAGAAGGGGVACGSN